MPLHLYHNSLTFLTTFLIKSDRCLINAYFNFLIVHLYIKSAECVTINVCILHMKIMSKILLTIYLNELFSPGGGVTVQLLAVNPPNMHKFTPNRATCNCKIFKRHLVHALPYTILCLICMITRTPKIAMLPEC